MAKSSKKSIRTESVAGGKGSTAAAAGSFLSDVSGSAPPGSFTLAKAKKLRGKRKISSVRQTVPKSRKETGRPSLDISDDDIRIRAYLISERRLHLSSPGDAITDWFEARRQLLEEVGGSQARGHRPS
ncbi:MAG: hypothetical protein ABJB32_03710 [Verrucomicrobiota bacterium]